MNMIVLCGLPCSGKSTFCSSAEGYEVISQDQLGSRPKCIRRFYELMEAKKDVIIDRTNINKAQRKIWIDLAVKHGYDVHCIYFQVPTKTCLERIKKRKGHPTIPFKMPKLRKEAIILKFAEDLQEPTMEEGFKSIRYLKYE
jgi:bifunctional polynucleotide phosphatase/kinase